MSFHNSPYTIYILALHNNKYYVGQSTNMYRTLKDHFNHDKNAPEWVAKHVPYRIEKLVRNCQPHDLEYYIIYCMNKYGIDNVRGGIYNQIELNCTDRLYIEQEIKKERLLARQIIYL